MNLTLKEKAMITFAAATPKQRVVGGIFILAVIFCFVLIVRIIRNKRRERIELYDDIERNLTAARVNVEVARKEIKELQQWKSDLTTKSCYVDKDYDRVTLALETDDFADISEVNPEFRVALASLNAHLFEHSKWANSSPNIFIGTTWRIQPIPPLPSSVLSFRVWDSKDKYFVTVLLDAYNVYADGSKEQPMWIIKSESMDGTLVKKVALRNEKALRKAITDCLEFEAKQFDEAHPLADEKEEETTTKPQKD